MIAQKLNIHVLFLSALVCLTSAHLGAMEGEESNTEKHDEKLKKSLSGELKRSLSSEKESETQKSPVGSPRRKNQQESNKAFYFNLISLKENVNNYFFKGWAPTLAFLVGATTYCIKNDRQAPLHAATWAKDTFQEMPWYLKYPGLLVGSCWMYSYYKPRINNSVAFLKEKMS
jgi:hypothetical protein